ncbi:hypothetical protein A6J64_019485 [Yersinia enterocolitica]|nr:hypothetical protein A6J64_019485 [Yersinia enterocolitica]PNM19304.1 hypothetical protein A6J65_010730 [Yersinia enterocolitica]
MLALQRQYKPAGKAAYRTSAEKPSLWRFFCVRACPNTIKIRQINILRHSRRFFICACKALLPAAP